MHRPLASLVVVSHNGERFLHDALESAFAQDYAPVEVVLVDDGSTDGTPEIAKAFAMLRYVRQRNQGAPAARNAGVAAARGEFVGFLDDDDVLPPTKLSVQVGHLVAHPNVGCVLGRQEVMLEGVDAPEWLTRDRLYGDVGGIPIGSAVVRRRVLEQLGGFDPSYRFADDRDLLVRMREQGVEVAVLPDVVLYRRFHGDNLSFKERPAKHPLLRSLKEKVDRERAAGTTEGET